MLDEDLSKIYQVETKRLNEAVKRNIDRFPPDFMFQLTKEEYENLKSQFATSSWGGRRKLPFAFTEHGVVMNMNKNGRREIISSCWFVVLKMRLTVLASMIKVKLFSKDFSFFQEIFCTDEF